MKKFPTNIFLNRIYVRLWVIAQLTASEPTQYGEFGQPVMFHDQKIISDFTDMLIKNDMVLITLEPKKMTESGEWINGQFVACDPVRPCFAEPTINLKHLQAVA